MDLTTLNFNTNTQQLLDAKKAIDDLAISMSNLNKVQVQEAKSAKDSAKSKESLIKTTDESTESTKKSTTVLERQQAILEFMTQGFSKGQSSVLAYAKSTGALSTELKELEGVLQTQRKLIGGDTFDKSMSGLTALKNQYGEIREAIRQYNAETDLTRNQTRELARDKERIIERMKLEGASFSSIKAAIKDYNAVYAEQAARVNSLIGVEKERERTTRNHINAVKNVQSAEERLFATVSHINDGLSSNANLNERAALAVGSYERNLRLAGITGEQASQKLQKFKAAQEQITALERKRQGDYIARAAGVQIGDVGVSLASGQNPLIVMIQQGDQLRSILQTAGKDGVDLKNVMNDAAVQIARSFKDVGIAVGTFVSGAFVSAGRTLKDALLTPLVATSAAVNALFTKRDMNLDLGPQISNLTLASREAYSALTPLFKVIGTVGVVAFLSITKAMYDANKQTDEVIKQFALSGNSLGLAASSISMVRDDLASMNITMTTSSAVLAEMSKAGNLTASEIQMVAKAANDMERYAGVAIEDTVKAFSKMKQDPVEALAELSSKTGLVSVETFKSVLALKEQGYQAEASSMALTELARVNSAQVEKMKEDYSSFTLTIKEMGAGIANFFDTVFKSLFDKYDFNVETKKIAAKTIEELSKIEDVRSRQGTGLSAAEQSRLDAAKATIEGYANEERAAKNAHDTRQNQIKAEVEGIKAKNELASLAEKGMSKEEKFRKESLKIGEAYSKAMAAAAGDQEKVNKLVKDYNLAMKSAVETRDKPERRSQAENDAIKAQREAVKSAIEDIQRSAKEEETLYKDRLAMIELVNKQSLVSIEDYYAGQKNALDEWLVSQSAALEKEKAVYEEAKKKATLGKDQEAYQGKINELIDKQAENEKKVATVTSEIAIKRNASLEQYKRLQDDINAQVLEYSGNLRAAAAIRFDAANHEAYKTAIANGNVELQSQLDLLRKIAMDKAEGRQSVGEVVTGLNRQGPIAKDNLAIQQQAYNVAMQQGTISAEVYRTKLASIAIEAAKIKNAMGFGDAGSIAMASFAPMLEGFTTLAAGISESIGKMFASLTDGIANSFAAGIVNGENFGTLMQNLSKNILQEFLSSLIKIGIQYMVNQMLGVTSAETVAAAQIAGTVATSTASTAALATTTTASTAAAAETTTAWTPAAAVTSIGSFGTSAMLAVAGIAAVLAIMAGIGGGFAEGGYTGHGGKYQPAGVVHKGEIVWSQSDIAKAGGVDVVEQMRKGNSGLANGGIVQQGFVKNTLSTPNNKTGGNSEISVSIENYGTSKDFEVQQLSETEVRIIARDEAREIVKRDTPNIVSSQIRNPNSAVSKSLNQNTQTQRRR